MREESAPFEVTVARIAARQHGVVTIEQLKTAGFDKSAVARRVKAGRLYRVHQGVYAVGHSSLGPEGRWMAAVLACGPGAVLSHASAAQLWGFLRPAGGPVDVSLPTRAGRRKRARIRVHRPRALGPRDVSRRSEIPVTTPRRTIRDLYRSDPGLARRAAREAQHAGFQVTTDRTRSDLESDFLAFRRRHDLPPPEINVRVGDETVGHFTVDFLWPAVRLVVETDSYDYHRGDVSFEDDHERDLALRHLGFVVLRYTGRQLERQGPLIAAEIRDRLRRDAPAEPTRRS
ncbi:MAG: type IV toxin-antitoxin system AbiEi family antitoxin domain-containing protein [Actinobacteria bacterium]|nr:type IV toxin-antitoxin system AbiEi family antitoxin domain-containing protein [Actinomycetota bacterium]